MKKILTLVSIVLSLAAVAGSTAPVNPAFLKWQRDRKTPPAVTNQTAQTGRQTTAALASVTPPRTLDAEAGGTGLVPSPLDLSYLKNLNSGAVKAPTGAGFPAKYDLRSEGLLTSVKNQGSLGTCWAHATCASLESWLLKSEGTATDFSEKNMASLHGFDWGIDDGGNMNVAAAYLLRWLGPVDETTDPYGSSAASRKSSPVRHVQAVKILPGRSSAMDNDRIKRALMDFGALYVSYCHSSIFYDARNHSYYCPDRYTSNHAVSIVGWDDTYNKANFAYLPNGVSPPGNGAWIVRNSWGSSWGEGGFFYVSYYDMTFGWGEIAAFASAEPADNYAGVYQYDDYGWVTSYGGSSTEAHGANIFKASAAASLAAVGFYAAVPNTDYTVTIRTGVTAGDPASGTARLVQSGRTDYAGYVTVPLESTVAVAKNQNFSVAVRFKTPGHNYPVPIEMYYQGYTSSATSSAGESFYSRDGVNWNDLYANNLSMNVCIKAYTKGTAVVALQSVEIDGETSLAAGASADYTCRAVYTDGSSRTVKPAWSVVSGSSYASISANGRLTARAVETSADVTLKAVHAEGGVTRETTMGVRILCGRPDVVTGLVASDDEADAVRLVWNAAANAETYSVYRARQDDARKAQYIGDTRGETTFADTTATPGLTYYYFVKALNASGASRDFSAPAAGVRRLSAPAEVRATDGSSYDAVTVTWSESTGARSYRVWRRTAAGDDEPAPVSGFLGASVRSFDDASAVPDVRYTYFVTAALDGTGRLESDLTTCDNGYRRMRVVLSRIDVDGPSTVHPSTSARFTANAVYSDGSVTNGVATAWQVETTVPGVTIDGTGLLVLPAFSETRPITVRATLDGRTGEKQIVLILPLPSAVTGLTASQGTSLDKVSLSWTAAAHAAKHAVYRDGARIAETAATTFADTTATPGTLYAYSVRGVNSAGESASAPTAQGYRRLAAPTQVMASNGTYSDRIRVKWRGVVGAAAYRVSRATSVTGSKTTVSSWTTATSFEDTTAASGVSYWYFVTAAATAAGERTGDASAAAVGLRRQVVTLADLVIDGPDAVQSGASARYTATAVYSDGSSEAVSPAGWHVSGDARVAADGTLASDAFAGGAEKVVTLTASFTHGGVTKTAEKAVRLVPIERTAEVTQLVAAPRFPFNGLVDIDFTLANTPADTRAAVSFSGRDRVSGRVLTPRTVTGDRANLESGDHRLTWNLAADYPGFHTESFTVDLTAAPMPENPPDPEHAAVQLWADGPYWATTNVGAEKPEDYGYYFWWGDTVGYVRNAGGNGWVASDGSGRTYQFHPDYTPTDNKTVDELKSLGYVDANGNLTAEHDAATQHWGAGWRMPTDAEFGALLNNCDSQWTTQNGVAGRVFKGRGAFAGNSIFVPAAGGGDESYLYFPGSDGYCWSSTPDADGSYLAWFLRFESGDVGRDYCSRYGGVAVRPVREFATPGPAPSAFPTISAFTAAGREPVDGKLDLNLTIVADEWPTNAVTLSFAAVDNVGGTNLTVRTLVYEDGKSATITAAGDCHVVWNAAADLGRVALSNVTLTATLAENGGANRTASRETSAVVDTCVPLPDPGDHAAVQLWADGPYWATTNVGADKPEDSGYHFWWGDTVGYQADTNAATWTSGYYWNGVTWVSSTGERMRASPFGSSTAVPTYSKTVAELKSMGYVDANGTLTAGHDAATQHWGAGWRMPTDAEFGALLNNCDSQWTTQNGVAGRVFKGRGAFAGNSIFVPAAGFGDGSDLYTPGSYGDYWSSAPNADNSNGAWNLGFYSGNVDRSSNRRYGGFAVRPVREFATPGPVPSAFPTISAFTAAGREPVDGKLDLNLTIVADEWPTNAVTLSFAAVDNVGGTNLTVRTLVFEDGKSSTITAAGDYHVVWNAAADLGRVALSNVTITATLAETVGGAIATALEATAWTFVNDSSAPWSIDATEKTVGASSVKSGAISDNGMTKLSTTVTGPGTLGFRWKIDSESGYDYLHLYVDGSEIFNNKSLNQTWETKSYAISGSGTHTVEWRYTKDGSVSNGSDCGWVDGITWNGAHPQVTGEGRRSVRETSAVVDTCVPLPDSGDHAAVQLWADGPYWATTNVGAEKPEDSGYYFWWGDTVGYTRSGGTWLDNYYYSGVTWVSSTGERMSSSPFNFSTEPTYNKTVAELKSMGYVDANGTLTAEHDAATQHWGAGWRMPTDAEFGALLNNCDSQWTTQNGVAGRVFKGRGAFAGNSIFVPAAGFGDGSNLYYPGSFGYYWSSSPYADDSYDAWTLDFYSGNVNRDFSNRSLGFAVRPVREFAK